MVRKSFSFVLIFAIAAVFAFASVSAKPKKKRRPERVSNPPTLSLAADPTVVKACAEESGRIHLTATARAADGGPLRYRWTTNGGRLRGEGANPTWDLNNVQPGVYQAVVEVDNGRELDCVAFSSVSVVVIDCPPPPPQPPPACPTVNISCPEVATENAAVTFTATLSGGSADIRPGFKWTVSAGRITSGQGTPSITVDTAGMAGQTVRASLDVNGYGMPCPASCAVSIPIENKPRKFDEYYDIARNDEKARLDNYAIQLQSEPGSQGYVIVYPARKAGATQAEARAKRISDYLINSRGIDSSRFTITMGPARDSWLFELWIVPEGAKPPAPMR
jgi:hypothetical protein